MPESKPISMRYGQDGIKLLLPASTVVLEGENIQALSNPATAVREALANPIRSLPLSELLAMRKPRTVAITISDITRSVPNRDFLPEILRTVNEAGIEDNRIVIIIGTGMHRPSTAAEQEFLVGREILDRIEVIDHRADDSATLVRVQENPPISVCSRFAQADFRIVTGFIEPHFMAGFSGGRKGVCPALVDLETVQRFHGYKTMADPRADTGTLANNPCHEIALNIAKTVGVDFLFNVAVTRDHRMAGIYCGDLEAAHQQGCKQVAEWTTAWIDRPFDLVVTNGGGYPLDQTFYQTVKGMCTALPALGKNSTLLQVSQCAEGLGSDTYTKMMLQYNNDWPRFLEDIEASQNETRLDQWEYQMQTRVLNRIGLNKLWFVSDGIPQEMQQHISVTPILGQSSARERAQKAIDRYIEANPNARIAVIPEGPYTLLRRLQN
ncbi:MAG: nickel-dependent lactate racemase [Hyphomicrobium sp.]|uniref:nickel-dependent lactate racemase n=1 Tax=Hyphomicrobium sp. TaxID=82 RepID=UPI0035675D46